MSELYEIFRCNLFNFVAKKTKAGIRIDIDPEQDILHGVLYTDVISRTKVDPVEEISYGITVPDLSRKIVLGQCDSQKLGNILIEGFRKKLMNYYMY